MVDPRLLELIKSKSQGEITEQIFAQAKYYPHLIRVYISDLPITMLDDGYELAKKVEYPKQPTETLNKEDNIERSLRRTKAKIYDYAMCNQFDIFATFTFAEDRQNIDRCKERMNTWLKNEKRRKGKFEYLIVPEFHKDGESLHFHALLQGYVGELRRAFNPDTGKPLGNSFNKWYMIPSYTHGFTNAMPIKQTPESYSRMAQYIRKYITKDMPVFSNKNRYWVSHNLNVPLVENNPKDWYANIEPDHVQVVDNGVFFYFDRDKTQPIIDIFWEQK